MMPPVIHGCFGGSGGGKGGFVQGKSDLEEGTLSTTMSYPIDNVRLETISPYSRMTPKMYLKLIEIEISNYFFLRQLLYFLLILAYFLK